MYIPNDPFDNWPYNPKPLRLIDVDTNRKPFDLARHLREQTDKAVKEAAQVFELKDGAFHLNLLLPGYSKENIQVSVTGNNFQVHATKGGISGDEIQKFSATIPGRADTKRLELMLEFGILRVAIPVTEPTVYNIQIP